MTTDNGQILTRKAHLSLQLSWAKNFDLLQSQWLHQENMVDFDFIAWPYDINKWFFSNIFQNFSFYQLYTFKEHHGGITHHEWMYVKLNAINSWKGHYSTHSFMYLCLQEWVRPVCSFLVLGVWVCYVSVQLLEGLVNDIDSQLQGFLHFGDELRLSLLPCLLLFFTSFFTLGWVFLADIFIIDSLSSKKLAGT